MRLGDGLMPTEGVLGLAGSPGPPRPLDAARLPGHGHHAARGGYQQAESHTVCPILLTQPDADRWTPLGLSELVLRRVTRVPVTRVLLTGAGHYPLEQPGLTQMTEAILAFIGGLIGAERQ